MEYTNTVARDASWEAFARALNPYPLPQAVVDLDVLAVNAAQVLERAGSLPVRLGTKSLRSRAVMHRLLASDSRFHGLLCYSADEAVFLSRGGFDDLLVAYPTVQPPAVDAVCARLREGAVITLMVDDPVQVRALEALGARAGVVLPVCLDVDMSVSFPGLYFGVRRSPVNDVPGALAVWREICACKHVRLDGVMGYEAQISGLADAVPGQPLRSALIRQLKRRSIPRIAARRQAVVAALREAGAELRFVNGGGTGSLESTRADGSVTELTAGSAFYAPLCFDHYRAFRHRPAAFFALEVTRRPAADMVTCNGGGYIASGGHPAPPQPWLPEGLSLLPDEGAGEVQTPLRGRVAGLEVGDPVLFRHAKAGELCERFTHLLLLAEGQISEEVTTYRGDGQCFF